MNGSVAKAFAAAMLVAALSSCATGGGAPGWITLVDGTKGLDNFNRVGEANWTAVDGAIQATQDGRRLAPPTFIRNRSQG